MDDKPQSTESDEASAAAVRTRSAAKKIANPTPLSNPDLGISADRSSFLRAQSECNTLQTAWDAFKREQTTTHHGRTVEYELIDDLLYSVCLDAKDKTEVGDK